MGIKIMYFVHGTTSDNTNKICSGWKEAMLNELGKEQAKNLGDVSKNRKDQFDIVFTSDLKRAIESADIAFPQFNKVKDERLRECNYGDLDGQHKSFVIYGDHINERFNNGESLKDVEARMRNFLSYVKKEYDGKIIAIVAHRAPQLALEVILNGYSWEQAIENDWRKTGDWKPGWEYIIK